MWVIGCGAWSETISDRRWLDDDRKSVGDVVG